MHNGQPMAGSSLAAMGGHRLVVGIASSKDPSAPQEARSGLTRCGPDSASDDGGAL